MFGQTYSFGSGGGFGFESEQVSGNAILDAVTDLGSAYFGYKTEKERIKSLAPSGQTYSEGQPAAPSAPAAAGISSGMLVLAIAAIVIFAIKD